MSTFIGRCRSADASVSTYETSHVQRKNPPPFKIAWLPGEEAAPFGDAGYQGIHMRPDTKADITWRIAKRPGNRRILNKENAAGALIDKAEKIKAGIRSKLGHPFRVIKRQFVYVKVRSHGLMKNTTQLVTLFALSNMWMVRGNLMGVQKMNAPN